MALIDILRKRWLKFAAIAITNNCNLRCKMCDTWKIKDKKEMQFKDFKEIIKKLKCEGIKTIAFTGYGEPLMHKNFGLFADYAFSQGFGLILITNGTLIRKYSVNTLKKFKKIRVSLDSIKNYSGIRGKDKVSKVIKNILFLKKNKINIEIMMLISSNTYTEIKKILSFFKKRDIKVNFGLTYTSPTLNFYELKFEKKQIRRTIELIEKETDEFDNLNQKKALIDLLNKSLRRSKKDLKGGCIMPIKTIVVLPNGNVLSCYGQDAFLTGNLLKNDLKEIFEKNKEKISRLVFGKIQCNNCLNKKSFAELVFEKLKL